MTAGGSGFCSAHTTPVTSQFGEPMAHQVRDWHTGDATGLVRTVCGRWIVPAPLETPLGTPCAACTVLIPVAGDGARGRRRRPGLRG